MSQILVNNKQNLSFVNGKILESYEQNSDKL